MILTRAIVERPQLRGYQVQVVQRLRLAFRQAQRVLCVLPTGGGKTVVASWLIDSATAKGNRVLFLAHRAELIDQASAKLDAFGVPHGVIKAGHERQDLSQAVQVASVQTLVRRLPRLTAPDLALWGGQVPGWAVPFDLIVVDECHHTCAGSYQRVLDAYPDAKVLGLTATPYRLDGQGLGDHFEHLEVGAHVPDLIQAGWLVPTRTFAPPPPAALGQVHTTAGEYSVGEAADVLNTVGPRAEIVATWQRRAAGRLTVAFCCTVAHAEAVAEAFRAQGVAAAAIDGDTPQARRDEVLRDLAAGRLKVVCNCALLTEGWDLPACAAVILARPTQSRALWRQMVGRGMRSAAGKTDCVILDHAGNVHRFGTPDDADGYSLQDVVPVEYDLGGKAICPNALCAALVDAYLFKCPHCDTRLPAAKRESSGGGRGGRGDRSESASTGWDERGALELTEARSMTERERRDWYAELLAQAERRGFKAGWAAHRYKDRFSVWPPTSWRMEVAHAR